MAESESSQIIADNLSGIHQRIAAAARRAGRDPDEIAMVAVTKYVNNSIIRLLAAAGCRDFGESRPQQLWQKGEALSDLSIRWHLVGHLQRNKIKRTLPWVSLIHSADSRSLLLELNRHGMEMGRRIPVLLEVNVSGDRAKHGFAPEGMEGALAEFAGAAGLEIRGLMAMAGMDHRGSAARSDFRQLRTLAERLRDSAQSGLTLDDLSMGMSGDFEEAIEEGATIVRVGSALFEGIPGADA